MHLTGIYIYLYQKNICKVTALLELLSTCLLPDTADTWFSCYHHWDSCLIEFMAWWLSSAQCTLYFFEVKYVHERQQGGGNRHFPPLEIGTKKQKF